VDGFFWAGTRDFSATEERHAMKKPISTIVALTVFGLSLLVGPPARAQETVTLMTHDSFNVSPEVIALFETANHATVRFLKAGDAGAALVQAILSKNNPMADVFFGVDNTYFSRALAADIFQPHASPLLSRIPAHLQLDPQHRLLPVDFGDVCLNYDKGWFADHKIAPPTGLADLIRPEYKGLTVVENPATSSPGLAFLLATIGRFGTDGYIGFWKGLRANAVLVANGWEDAYYGHFTAASKGDRPIVVSYASSPPAEVHFAEQPTSEAPTAAVLSDRSAFRQIEFAGVLKGTGNPELAGKLVDFLLDRPFQEDIPLQMFMSPANHDAALPDVFPRHSRVARQPAEVAPADIEAHRAEWLESWTTAMLR
jgi:thiamine transport system substrate-binding protein